jgi:hypothetical protein
VNARTDSYRRYGLHAIRDLHQKAAWISHLQGKTVRLHDLPTNGDQCTEGTIGGSVCGFPILIDGSCPNAPEHGEVEIEVTDAMVEAATIALDQAGLNPMLHPSWIRIAIEAALRAQEAGQ